MMKRWISLIGGLVIWLGVTTSVPAQGIYAPGAGPINRSMGGASTAYPSDFGASYWNAANISFLDRTEMLIGTELVVPSTHMTAFVPMGAVNGVLPSENRYGTARSNSGVASNIAVGASYKLDEASPFTFGILVNGVVGGNVNFPGKLDVPILTPQQPPRSFGFGPIYANTALISTKPMISYALSDRLAFAVSPVVVTGSVQFNPAFFAPGPPDRFGVATFPPATNSRPFWGGGFELGLLYELNEDWNVGFSYKSPVWQERWSYNTINPDLSPRYISTLADIPSIYSWGVAYKGLPKTVIDVDFRYFDYANAALWGQKIVDGGLAWQSIFAVAVGGAYELTERMTLRGGYLFNENPVNDATTLFNVQAPGFIQHTLSLGLSMKLAEHITMTAGWVHGFRNEIEGPILQLPDSTVKIDTQYDSIVAGLNIQYGGKKTAAASPRAGVYCKQCGTTH